MKHIPADEPREKDNTKEEGGGGGGGGGSGGTDGSGERTKRWVGKGRLEELLRQAGAWQVQQAWQRGSGPWTLKR